jgi:hypothetical protein
MVKTKRLLVGSGFDVYLKYNATVYFAFSPQLNIQLTPNLSVQLP